MAPCILVVEDTPELVELYRDILTEEGYAVAVYPQAVLDMRDVERIAPELIILDYLLGGEVDGLQMLHQLKRHPATAAIPVILCTAAVKTINAVADDVRALDVRILYKPFELNDLLDLVNAFVQHGDGTRASVPLS
jgi:DNA-binding response OmpR family regulator